MNVIVDTGVAYLNLLATPVELESFSELSASNQALQETDYEEAKRVCNETLRRNHALLHAAPPPEYEVITEFLLAECEGLRNKTFGKHFQWGATNGSRDCNEYTLKFEEYLTGIMHIFKRHKEHVKAASEEHPSYKIIADQFVNKLDWMYHGHLLDDQTLNLDTPLPIITPNLIVNLTSLLSAQEDGWNEVSDIYYHTLIFN